MPSNIGTSEIILILFILFFLFGASKLKDFARNAGEATKELKTAKKEIENSLKDETEN